MSHCPDCTLSHFCFSGWLMVQAKLITRIETIVKGFVEPLTLIGQLSVFLVYFD